MCKQGVPGLTEEMCRFIIEILLDKKFPRTSPDWLVNREGNRMILDGYCKELNIAFEYNGEQHYEFIPHFHRTFEEFIKRCSSDNDKQDKCNEMDVKLVVIPYRVKRKNLETFIRIELARLGIDVKHYNEVDINKNFRNKYIDERNEQMDSKLSDSNFTRIDSFTKTKERITIRCNDCSTEREIYYWDIIRQTVIGCSGCDN
jgi:hypothetical protein